MTFHAGKLARIQHEHPFVKLSADRKLSDNLSDAAFRFADSSGDVLDGDDLHFGDVTDIGKRSQSRISSAATSAIDQPASKNCSRLQCENSARSPRRGCFRRDTTEHAAHSTAALT